MAGPVTQDRLTAIQMGDFTGAKTPVIFLHGFGGLAEQWHDLQAKIAEHAPTLAFDLPGHGGSLAYTGFGPPKVAARAVIAELEQRGIARAHFVGHSMGGAVSCLVALFAPERCASLTLLAPGGFGPEIAVEILERWAAAKTGPELERLLPRFFAVGHAVPDAVVEMHKAARAQAGASEALVHIASGMTKDGKQGTLPLDSILDGSMPVSLVWGTKDTIVPVSQTHELEKRLDLHIVGGMGHMPAEEAPELVEHVILTQLS